MNKPPPLIVGITLLFWGWQTGFMPIALLMAGIIEGAQVVGTRWEFSNRDFTRIWTFCAILLLATGLYSLTSSDTTSLVMEMMQNPTMNNQRRATNSSSQAIASLLRWLPMVFFPFLVASVYSVGEGVPLQTISLILQWRWKRAEKLGEPPPSAPPVSVGYPYFALCLFSASIHPSETTEFFWGFCALLAWALWTQRSSRYALPLWGGALLVAIALGYGGQLGIRQAQSYLGSLNPAWLFSHSRRGFDPTRNRTSIGDMGTLKTSDQIVLRLETPEANRPPELLREVVYRTYAGQTWTSGTAPNDYATVPETNATSYVLASGEHVTLPLRIACYLGGGEGVLPMPLGTAMLENLPAFIVRRNSLGTVVAVGPGLVIYTARYGPGISTDAAPEPADGSEGVPPRETAALEQVIDELDLKDRPLPTVLRTLNSWFQTNFTYTVVQRGRQPFRGESPLNRFLTKTRAGHCEYYATASVLLLRQLGFSARYAVGYAVHEPAGQNKYVVRQKDAHAWCMVWRDGRWHEFDPTPASWLEKQNEQASPFRWLSDLWSRIVFEFSRIRYGQTQLRKYLLWALIPVLGILVWQIAFAKRNRKKKGGRSGLERNRGWPGLDSEFYRVEKTLARRGYSRGQSESVSDWLERVDADPVLEPIRADLHELQQLHYRYRFDPAGLADTERQQLRNQVDACVDRIPSNLSS